MAMDLNGTSLQIDTAFCCGFCYVTSVCTCMSITIILQLCRKKKLAMHSVQCILLITTSLVQKRDHGVVFPFLTRSSFGVACVALRAAVLAIAAANGIR